ncbi:hypothetical protein AAEX28_07205 [Lentisphaerota bacterium WC36G]|nr:hypothetical protein LJT99_10070 [Lentisphaerae bacterium WC36]UDQ99305.1 hypothetical protein LJT99_07145 [Lentisphaerae bacterium WC36]
MSDKRTQADFSKHELIVKEFDIDGKKLTIHHFKQRDSHNLEVKITNFDGNCTITGDLGNYIACREFIPTANNIISDYYFCEKLTTYSTQKVFEFDANSQIIELAKWEKELLEDITNEDEIEEIKEQFTPLFDACKNGSQQELEVELYNSDLEFDEFQPEQKIETWLLMIFDAFEEIGRRLAEKEKKEVAE